jgi:hypothetical protein
LTSNRAFQVDLRLALVKGRVGETRSEIRVAERHSAIGRVVDSGANALLIDLEEDKAAPAVIWGVLREMERRE